MHSSEPPLPLDLLGRSENIQKLLSFLRILDEEISTATADAVKLVPDVRFPADRMARGAIRRSLINRAFQRAGERADVTVEVHWTAGKRWCYPVIQFGAFRIVPGLVEVRRNGAARMLRTRAGYVERLAARNEVLDPQGDLFRSVRPVIPDGSLGALLVTEHADPGASVPSFVGLWIPSPDLRKRYHCISLAQMETYFEEIIRRSRSDKRKPLERKLPRRKRNSDDGK